MLANRFQFGYGTQLYQWSIPCFRYRYRRAGVCGLYLQDLQSMNNSIIINDVGILNRIDWSRWLMAYRDALSFRCSHYFVSYFSEATTLAAGIDSSPTRNWAVTVTRPWNVELPRSLVEVVINWNIPMHAWLKNCE